MNKKKATKETIDSFMKAVYTEMTELAVTFASEDSILRDATEQITTLKAENDKLRRHQAICECGVVSIDHSLSDNHQASDMPSPCPFKEQVATLKAEHENRCGAASKCIAMLQAELAANARELGRQQHVDLTLLGEQDERIRRLENDLAVKTEQIAALKARLEDRFKEVEMLTRFNTRQANEIVALQADLQWASEEDIKYAKPT